MRRLVRPSVIGFILMDLSEFDQVRIKLNDRCAEGSIFNGGPVANGQIGIGSMSGGILFRSGDNAVELRIKFTFGDIERERVISIAVISIFIEEIVNMAEAVVEIDPFFIFGQKDDLFDFRAGGFIGQVDGND